MRALCTHPVSCTVINGHWEDEEVEDEEQEEGKVETRPVWWPAGCSPSPLSTPPSLHLCIPLLTCCSFSSGLFDKLPVPMPSVQCPLSTPIKSYIYQRFLLTKKKLPLSKWLKMIFNFGDSQGYGEFRQWANGNKVPHLHIFIILFPFITCVSA